MVAVSHKRGAARLFAVMLSATTLPGCGLHLYRQEHAQLAQSAKATFTEKVDLLAIVATERANLAKQRDVELAAVQQNQILERDLVFFNAAKLKSDDRFLVLALPHDEKSCRSPNLLKLRYVARRVCDLGASTPDKLKLLANAEGDVYRSHVRREFIEEGRADLQKLGWIEAPRCDGIPAKDAKDDKALQAWRAKALGVMKEKVAAKDQGDAESVIDELIANCQTLAGYEKNLGDSSGLQTDLNRLKALQREETTIVDEGKKVAAELQVLANRLQKLAEGEAKPGDTRKKIAEDAKKLRELLDKAENVAAKLGAQDALADLHLDAAATLLQALEGEPIPEDKLKGEDGADLRRAVVVAQTVPQLADEIRMIDGLLNAPSKSSLLIAQRQALLDKENIAARKAQFSKRIELVRRRISLTIEEARLLQLAAAQTSADECKKIVPRQELPPEELKVADAECERGKDGRLLLGFYYLSRSMLGARAGQEATRWEEIYLQYDQNIAANEYALKSWNNLIGTPIVLLEGYHTGGIKAESLGDLIFKAGGLGLLGVAVTKVD